MNNQVSKSQLKAKALEFFRQVENTGEPLIVTDHGKPKLELRRYQPTVQNPLETLRGSVLRYEGATEPVGEEEWDAAH